MQSTKTLRELLVDARASGRTTSDLARIAGCSRMQLWRLYSGKVTEKTPLGVRLRAALEGDEVQAIMTEVMESARRLAAGDPKRAGEVLSMLQSVTNLSSELE